jgi:peptide/nickel transport system ATP-binding protein
MSESVLLRVDHLGIAFRRGKTTSTAVYDSTFEVHRGKTLAIVGESGSGKSVSSLSLMHLLHRENTVFTSGRFMLDGSILQTPPPPNGFLPTDPALATLRGKKIAMIFQEPMTSLNPVLTCGFQVEEVLIKHLSYSREKARLKTLELFNEVKLPRAEQMLDQYPHQLSGHRLRAAFAYCRRANDSTRCHRSKGNIAVTKATSAQSWNGHDFHNT